MSNNFEEKVANSFVKVREDIAFLKEEINKIKKYLLLKNNDVLALKSEIKALNELVLNIKGRINNISTGNGGAINNHQQSSTIINNDLSTGVISAETQNKPIKTLIESKFRSLTDMEFSIFMTIYQLEEEIGKVTYSHIANRFNLTEATVRNHITNLLNKGIPIDKERLFNKKTFFYIKKEFRDLNMASQLLLIRPNSKNPSMNPKNT